jgi:hypothetical protein
MVCRYFFILLTSARPVKTKLFLVFIALVLFIPADFLLYAQNSNQKLRFVYNKKSLSISANDADLKNVLLKIAEETDIHVWFPNSLSKKISIVLNRLSYYDIIEKRLWIKNMPDLPFG